MVNITQVTDLLGGSWAKYLWKEFNEPYMQRIMGFLAQERRNYEVYPPADKVFRVYKETPYDDVRVVILGQDPYHTPHFANGLAFSVDVTTDDDTIVTSLPPSLNNIFKELESDIGFKPYHDPDLSRWSKQGVFLLNTTLTVRKGEAGSHGRIGWQQFTRKTIEAISDKFNPVVFVLWGNYAASFQQYIDMNTHFVIKSAHPSPLSAHKGFFGSKPFSKVNDILQREYKTEIVW